MTTSHGYPILDLWKARIWWISSYSTQLRPPAEGSVVVRLPWLAEDGRKERTLTLWWCKHSAGVSPLARHATRSRLISRANLQHLHTELEGSSYLTKKTARDSVNPFQRYYLLKTLRGRVGLGRAANAQISSLNHRRTRFALRARS